MSIGLGKLSPAAQENAYQDISPRRMNTRENLEYRKVALEEQLKNVNNAIEALDQMWKRF